MTAKHEKVSATLVFHVDSVQIKQDIPDQFSMSWSRGGCKGATSRSIPVDHVITFNETFRCKCTMYLSKPNRKVRQKLIKFVLKRLKTPEEKKVFGRVTIDVAKFFEKGGVSECTVEMESGRSSPPIVHFTFQFEKIGERKDAVADESDLSFVGKNLDSSTRDKWDSTEVVEMGTGPEEIRKMMERRGSELAQFMNKPRAAVGREGTSSKKSEQDLRGFMQTKKGKDYAKLFQPVLSVSWPPAVTQNFISMPYPYPPAVFPFIATLIHSEMLKNDDDIDTAVASIREMLSTAPLSPVCTNEKRLITFMMIYILIGSLAEQNSWVPERVALMQTQLKELVDSALLVYGRPIITKMETNLNRFATAQFDVDTLMNDMTEGFKSIKNSLTFPTPIKGFVFENLVAMIDSRMASKITSNPARLTFTNSMVWSSLITAFETASGEKLLLSSELAALIMVVPTVCKDPKLADEVCPHLSKEVVLRVLKNVQPDEMMSDDVDATEFIQKFELDPELEVEQVDARLNDDYMSLAPGIRICDWNACEIQADLVQMFPHLLSYTDLPTADSD